MPFAVQSVADRPAMHGPSVCPSSGVVGTRSYARWSLIVLYFASLGPRRSLVVFIVLTAFFELSLNHSGEVLMLGQFAAINLFSRPR